MSNLTNFTIMKKLMTLVLMMAIAFTAAANTHRDARMEARVMTDRMAYELRLSNHQIHAVYDINLRMHDPIAKEHALRRVLTARQFDRYLRIFRVGHHHGAPVPPPHRNGHGPGHGHGPAPHGHGPANHHHGH